MSFTRAEALRTQAWLRDHPYAEDAGLADQLADQLDPEPSDKCPACGSTDRWGTEGTEEHPGEWVLVCNACGHLDRSTAAKS